MTKKKDKMAVTDEVWNEARIKLFLDVQSASGVDADFHRLLKAYQSMRADDFNKFITFFKENNGNINALSPEGKTLIDIIKPHKHSQEYIAILNANV
jgi:hypothetical protein